MTYSSSHVIYTTERKSCDVILIRLSCHNNVTWLSRGQVIHISLTYHNKVTHERVPWLHIVYASPGASSSLRE